MLNADTRNPLSLIGAVITVVSMVLIVAFFAVELSGHQGSPYTGIVAFVILPTMLAFGLVLFNVGAWRQRRRRAASPDEAVPPLPVIDLNQASVRKGVLWGAVVLTLAFVVLGIATYKGVEVMDSTAFCGTTCHTVMQPEHTAFQRSPHARVGCTGCHIGEGASWFVKSKLSGTRQLFAVAFDTFSRPIPTPVHDLRPARETCEQCHWPEKFVGERLKVFDHFTDDEQTTHLQSVLLLKIGGVQRGKGLGIHWHVDPSTQIRYQSDPKREHISTVEMKLADGTVKVFRRDPSGDEAEDEEAGEARAVAHAQRPAPVPQVWRTMDCIDCHNRPTHIFGTPEGEVDTALAKNDIDRTLPYIRREAVRLLKGDYPSHQAAREALRAGLQAFYAKEYPEIASARADAIEQAGEALGRIFSGHVFPDMKVTWGTYPSFLGHQQHPGCLRCHDGRMRTETGEKISSSCTVCHTVLAQEEEDPEVLSQLMP
jgi:hypothetical protein